MICHVCYTKTGHPRKPFCSERCAERGREYLEAAEDETCRDKLDVEELLRAQRLWEEWKDKSDE